MRSSMKKTYPTADKEIILHIVPESEDGKEVLDLFRQKDVKYSVIPTYTCEVTQGLARYQFINQIQAFAATLPNKVRR